MNLDYNKYVDGLIPAIVQDAETGVVLMLGFVNDEAVQKTLQSGHVTLFSRSRQTLWTKGKTSGNFLEFVSMAADCDMDTLLIKARPSGPVCHTGDPTCFGKSNIANDPPTDWLAKLENTIDERRMNQPDGSYVANLFAKGLNKIAQKVGEEAVELVIAAKDADATAFKAEAADLLFHYLVLLRAKDVRLRDVLEVLDNRRK